MKIFLYILGLLFLIVPILLWWALASLGCGYGNGSNCGALKLYYFTDPEFFIFAAIPWFIAIVCFVFAKRAGRKAKQEDAT